MRSIDFELEPIQEDDLGLEPPLMKVVMADLAGPRKDIHRIFKLDKDLLPVDRLKHLRRVRDTNGPIECILTDLEPSEDCHDSEIKQKEFIAKIKKILDKEQIELNNYRIEEVPSLPAKTNAQLETYSKFWPVKYIKSEYLTKCIEGTIMDDNERLVVGIVVDGLLNYMNSYRQHTSGAVIFRYAKVYGAGLTCQADSEANPIKHSPMVAIDLVARNAGAGHWPVEYHSEGLGLMEKLQTLLDGSKELADHKMGDDFLPYICTNYDILTTEEPCMMCSMGLIQSRIRRLFYLDTTATTATKQSVVAPSHHDNVLAPVCYRDRAIEGFYIHRDKSINHRFEAWRIKLLTTTSTR